MRSLFLSLFALVAACGADDAARPPTPIAAEAGTEPPPHASKPAPDAAPAATTYCTLHGPHDFCADFDGDDPLGGWTDIVRGTDSKHKDEEGIVASDRSAPSALHLRGATLPTPEGGQDPLGPWSGMFTVAELGPTSKQRAHVAFDLRLDRVDDLVSVIELEGRKDHDRDIAFHVSLAMTPTHTYLSAADGTVPELPPMALGRWVHVDVVLDDGGLATLSYDGAVVGTAPFAGPIASSEKTSLFVGVSRTAPAGAYNVAYDSVTLDFE